LLVFGKRIAKRIVQIISITIIKFKMMKILNTIYNKISFALYGGEKCAPKETKF
jgi:hypothetical protein